MRALAIAVALAAALLPVQAGAQITWGSQPPPDRLPPSSRTGAPPANRGPPRVPIDLGPDAPADGPPQTIDILAPPQASAAVTAAQAQECKDATEVGVVSGEIVVCAPRPEDTTQSFSGSREAWLKGYAERTQNRGTLPPPDVAGPGIFRGAPTISGLCFFPPCPKGAPLIIDVTAIPTPPSGSDAERVARGLAPLESDDAPVDADSRKRIEAELGLPEAGTAEAKKDQPKPKSRTDNPWWGPVRAEGSAAPAAPQ